MNRADHILEDTARVWVYMSDRAFDESEVLAIGEALNTFTDSWAAHGKGLNASGNLLYNRFIILMVDEASTQASGCSIDSSVRFIKELEESYGVNFFNRMLVACENNSGDIEVFHTSELSKAIGEGHIGPDTLVFNNLVQSKADLDSNWKIPLSASVYSRWL